MTAWETNNVALLVHKHRPNLHLHLHQVISYYSVAEELRLGPGCHLFTFLASCIKVTGTVSEFSDFMELDIT